MTQPTHDKTLSGSADPKTGIFRHGFGMKEDVATTIASDYLCPVVERLKANDFQLDLGYAETAPGQVNMAAAPLGGGAPWPSSRKYSGPTRCPDSPEPSTQVTRCEAGS